MNFKPVLYCWKILFEPEVLSHVQLNYNFNKRSLPFHTMMTKKFYNHLDELFRIRNQFYTNILFLFWVIKRKDLQLHGTSTYQYINRTLLASQTHIALLKNLNHTTFFMCRSIELFSHGEVLNHEHATF